MSESPSSVEPIAGQLWTHEDHDYTVVTTRVTSNHVHYKFWTEEPTTQANAAREFLEEEFGHVLAYIAPQGGSCMPPEDFTTDFEYQQERPRESYESAPNTDATSADTTGESDSIENSE